MQLQSIIKCPYCGHVKKEIMPTNSCQHSYECESCHKKLTPQGKDCCVFCSYGSVKCPIKQNELSCFTN